MIAKSTLLTLAAVRKMYVGFVSGSPSGSPPDCAARMNCSPMPLKMNAPKIATTIRPSVPPSAMLLAVLSVLAWRSSPPTNVDQ